MQDKYGYGIKNDKKNFFEIPVPLASQIVNSDLEIFNMMIKKKFKLVKKFRTYMLCIYKYF